MYWVGNKSLRISLNAKGLVDGVYSLNSSDQNHVDKGAVHNIGVFIDGQISWLGSSDWEIVVTLKPGFICETNYVNQKLALSIKIESFVPAAKNIFIRNLEIKSTRQNDDRTISLFLHQAFSIGNLTNIHDFANYSPSDNLIIHANYNSYFGVSAKDKDGRNFSEHTLGEHGVRGLIGTFVDAEDNQLTGNNQQIGKTDSVVKLDLKLTGQTPVKACYQLLFDQSLYSLIKSNDNLNKASTDVLLKNQLAEYNAWLENIDKISDKVPSSLKTQFLKAVKEIKFNELASGAFITDFNQNYNYFVSGTKDSAQAVWALTRMGFTKEPLAYFDYIKKQLKSGKILLPFYYGSGKENLDSIQFDRNGQISINLEAIALTLFSFAQYYFIHSSKTVLKLYFQDLVKPLTKTLRANIDQDIYLPVQPSTDQPTATRTVAVVYAALLAVAEIAEEFKDMDEAVASRVAAEDIFRNAPDFLYVNNKELIASGFKITKHGLEIDNSLSSEAVHGAFMFGLFDRNSTAQINSINQIIDQPIVDFSSNRSEKFWLAQIHIEKNNTEKAIQILTDIINFSRNDFTFSESVEFVHTVLDLISE